MKRFLLLVAVFCILGISFFLQKQKSPTPSNPSLHPTSTGVPIKTPITQTTIFVPYWTLPGQTITTKADTYIYFGISASKAEIDTTDDGYKNINKFLRVVPEGSKKLLAIRMLNSDITESVLHDDNTQESIIAQAVQIAKNNGFDGVVLDMEYNALAFDSVVASITSFSNRFATSSHAENLLFYQTIFGDNFYRSRPYNVKRISNVADGVFVMAYDFHKANGNPGPNFPLSSSEDSNYSFPQMVKDFSQAVTKEKLTIIFGMFGYDWTLNSKGNSTSTATTYSNNEITQNFINPCDLRQCRFTRNKDSEPEITYIDGQGSKHEIWFEDMDSIAPKKQILSTQGISSIGFWAYSYF